MFNALTRSVLEPPAVGIDISDLTIKFVRLSRLRHARGEVELDYFGEIEIPAGVVVDGEIKKEPDLAAILKERFRTIVKRFSRDRFCIASLPEEKSFVRVVELPNVKSEDVARALRWEVEGVIPLPIDDIYYDFESAPASLSDRREILITAFPRVIIETYHRVLRQAGFTPLALELESQSISRAVIETPSFLDPVIIIDIGASRTSFIIFAAGSLVFTKSIRVGGRDFENAIADRLGVSADEARAIKIEAGLNKSYRGGQAFEALSQHLAAIVAELGRQMQFYQGHAGRRGDIRRIILCGGDANLVGIEKYIATAVKKLTVLGNPFANLKLQPGIVPPIPKNQSLKYTTALGLALRGVGY